MAVNTSNTDAWREEGLLPCGITNPVALSDDPSEVTCYLCRKWLEGAGLHQPPRGECLPRR